ncbi:MAG: ASKHA domain-containing protein, partial [Chloroflexota bacterium]
AVDIGTTTVTVYLVDLFTGQVVETAADYNGQIKRGEDVISRIVFASKGNGLVELQSLVAQTINKLVERATLRRKIKPHDIYKMTLVGNSTMIHILLGLPPEQIRLTPYITTINHPPTVLATELNLNIHPQAPVDCLPGVASYMGADITAGVLSSGTHDTDKVTLFLDIGTNGEMVLGTREWLVSCACSAGPAFEGAGVFHGMRATTGAIEEVYINTKTYEPTYRVIGGGKPRGLCGSGLISLIAEMFITGVTDKAGNINLTLPTPRVRQGEHGAEYVIAWASESDTGADIVITKPDIDNLLRAKAAIYAGYVMLAHSVGMTLKDVEQMLIGGSFGQYLNIEKAIEIGLLPDLPWDRFHFLGNTAARGAYMALLRRDARDDIAAIAKKMTYLELAADNAFTDQFTAALFLPHTDLTQFESVRKVISDSK